MAEETPKEPSHDVEAHIEQEQQHKERSAFHLRSFWNAFKEFLRSRLSIIDNADPKATIEGVERDVEFRGFNLWILIFSIFICSIGLNINNGPVIIGAMLISPLMGPIMGVGLAVGVNDLALLKKSLRNWGVAVLMGVSASTLYFYITPLHGDSSELLNRTAPTLLDVMVAIFGGTAGILAGSRRVKNNVIPGVAIATALMPPLCTAGYGIANGNLQYFLGATYLFLINSIFISLATTLVVRYLKFPHRILPDPVRERKNRRIALVILLIFVLPSIYVFYNVATETYYNQKIKDFVTLEIDPENATMVGDEKIIVDESGQKILVLSFIGEKLSEDMIRQWRERADEMGLEDLQFRIVEEADGGWDGPGLTELTTTLLSSQNTLESKNQEIERLRSQIRKMQDGGLPATFIEEIKVYNPQFDQIYAGQLQLSNARQDTLCNLMVRFKTDLNLSEAERIEATRKLSQFANTRLETDTVIVTELK